MWPATTFRAALADSADPHRGAAPVVVAADWGGTWIRVAAVADGVIVDRLRQRRPGPLPEQYDAIAALFGRVTAGSEREPVALGVGVAGVVQQGVVGTAANLGITDGTDVAAALRSRLQVPTYLVNDAQAAALGVATRWPHGLNAVVTMGTGIGGAVLLDGALVPGLGGAGDFGHVVVDLDGPACPCGGRGCLEQLVSGRVLAEAAEALADSAGSPLLMERRQSGRPLHAGDLQDAALAGDEAASSALASAAFAFAAGLRTIVATHDPDRIVLAGPALAESSWFGQEVRSRWTAVRPHWARTTLVHVPDDEDAALLGAAAHVLTQSP